MKYLLNINFLNVTRKNIFYIIVLKWYDFNKCFPVLVKKKKPEAGHGLVLFDSVDVATWDQEL